MRMNTGFDKKFLQRFVQGECSEGERANFLRWLENVEDQDEISWMKEKWELPCDNEHKILGAEERILSSLLERIQSETNGNKPTTVNKSLFALKSDLWMHYSLRYASIILMVLIPIMIYSSIFSVSLMPVKIAYAEKVTHNGQHLAFTLEDGSQITLNSNSNLTYPVVFSDSDRVVTLKGEAFFEVAKDSKRPFKVITGNVTTTALGTSFNINYPGFTDAAEISLLSGVVQVEVENKSDDVEKLILEPGEQVRVVQGGSVSEITEFDLLEISGWKDGVLYFKEADILKIVEILEVWYDVNITVIDAGNKSKDWTYTGQFGNQTLENVLRGIGYVKGFESRIKEKDVTIVFN
jgi:ferric-dicitrate binding protein FerR (iron transport regulator)